jgi:hypothetical protein
MGVRPVAVAKRRLKVRSASLDRLIISSTGWTTEKWSLNYCCARWISPSPWSALPSKIM